MRQSTKVEGTKIAQAAKDLNVTSVTIRRYLSEFNIETIADENGIKVLPVAAMDELREIRRLKEDGLTNPKVLEMLEERRANKPAESEEKEKPEKARKTTESTPRATRKVTKKEAPKEEEPEEAEEPAEQEPAAAPELYEKPARHPRATRKAPREQAEPVAEEADDTEEAASTEEGAEGADENELLGASESGRAKHSLTCQTCSKVFEHMNPRLRDCLDCYRAKRKERRKGGSERHKNVIQHPLATQALSKTPSAPVPQPTTVTAAIAAHTAATMAPVERVAAPAAVMPERLAPTQPAAVAVHRGGVRNYRKAIEETRQITSSLKRRLERPDLPEGERRWLEQIYAYQLILHQGWRHLSEYKQGGAIPASRQED